MSGTPSLDHFVHNERLSEIDLVGVPMLIMDAGNKGLFSTADNGGAAAAALERHGVLVDYLVIPRIDHYGIYFG